MLYCHILLKCKVLSKVTEVLVSEWGGLCCLVTLLAYESEIFPLISVPKLCGIMPTYVASESTCVCLIFDERLRQICDVTGCPAFGVKLQSVRLVVEQWRVSLDDEVGFILDL